MNNFVSNRLKDYFLSIWHAHMFTTNLANYQFLFELLIRITFMRIIKTFFVCKYFFIYKKIVAKQKKFIHINDAFNKF